jgi:uncharacterized protein DUF4265
MRHHGPVASSENFVRVAFKLERDAEGWPPASSESLWAEPLGEDLYRIDNTPWFVRDLAVDDVVRALAGDDGVLWGVDRLRWSGHLTIRVIPLREGPLEGSLQAVLDAFRPLGVDCEGFGRLRIAALDIPPSTPLPPVKRLLVSGVDQGWWEFEEGCINDEWRTLDLPES